MTNMTNCNASYGPYTACTTSRRHPHPSNMQPAFDRSNYVDQFGGRDYPYRVYPPSTTIHEESDDAQARKRSQVACARCRKRKIKCSGNPGDDSGCHACRNAGTAVSHQCKFERVGTQYRFGVDTSSTSGSSNAMAPTTCYSNGPGFLPILSIDAGSRHMSCLQSAYDRTELEQCALIDYQYHMGNFDERNPQRESRVTEITFDNDRNWNDRPATSLSGMEPAYQATYRGSDVLAPLGIESLQGPPPPFERRLPAPNFVGMPMSSESLTSPSSAMNRGLAGLSLYNGGRTGDTVGVGRQNSIQDLANASISLPAPSQQSYRTIAPVQRTSDSHTTGYSSPACSGAIYSGSTATSYPAALPPMHVLSNFEPYPQGPASAGFATSMQTSFSNDNESHSSHNSNSSPEQATEYYGWSTSNDPAHRQQSSAVTIEDAAEQRYAPLAPLMHSRIEQISLSPNGKVDSIMGDQSVKSRQNSQASGSSPIRDN